MTQNVQNFDNRNNGYSVAPRAAAPMVRPQTQALRIPDYYAPNDKKSFKDYLEENPMYSMGIKGFFGPLIEHPIASQSFGCFIMANHSNKSGSPPS